MRKILLILIIFLHSFILADSITYESAVLDDNPVGYWKLDEGSGSTASDISGEGHNGVYNNVSFSGSGPFTDSNSYIDIGSSTSSYVNISESGSTSLDVLYITMETWIKPDNYDVSHDRGIVINKEDAWEYGLQDGAGYIQSALYTSGWTWNGSYSVPLNTWSYVVVTYDGSRVKHYVNGTLVDSYAYTGTLIANDNDLKIGARGGDAPGSSYFEGGIAQVAIYNYALSESQIVSHYDAALMAATYNIPEPGTLILLLCFACTIMFLKNK